MEDVASNFSTMVETLRAKMGEVKDLIVLRGGEHESDLLTICLQLHRRLEDAEKAAASLVYLVEQEKQDVEAAVEVLRRCNDDSKRVERLAQHCNQYFIDQASETEIGNENANNRNTFAQQPAMNSKPSITRLERTEENKTRNNKSGGLWIESITEDEFAGVPQHVRGRSNLEKLNRSIEELNGFLQNKYRILNTHVSKLGNESLALLKVFKAAETMETKHLRFFQDTDLRMLQTLKLDATGKCMLGVLRHLGRVSVQSIGGVIRYLC